MPSVERAPLLVFDLDGTILRVNSFPRWALHLMMGRLPGLGLRRRVILSLHAILLVIARKLGRFDHAELQRRLQIAVAPCRPAMTLQFRAALLRYVRPNLLTALQIVRENRVDAVLATAACVEYAEELGRQLGFKHIVATQSDRSVGQSENLGEEKRLQVRRVSTANGWENRPLILLTDHIDDLPLMKDSSLVCWFGSPETLPEVRALADGVQFIDSRNMSAEELNAILRISGQHHPLLSR